MDLPELIKIMAALRGEKGCPGQGADAGSLKRSLLKRPMKCWRRSTRNPEAVKEELGDLLFSDRLFRAVLLRERRVRISDVIETIAKKMINRHPHVFGDTTCETRKR